jgi:hypothetical protein
MRRNVSDWVTHDGSTMARVSNFLNMLEGLLLRAVGFY